MPGQEISPGGLKLSLGSPGQLSQGDVSGGPSSSPTVCLLPAAADTRPAGRSSLPRPWGSCGLILAAHQLKRRRREEEQVGPEMGGEQFGTVLLPILMARKVPQKKGRCEVVGKGELKPSLSRLLLAEILGQ